MRPEITFIEKGHKYLVNGEEYPSVTQILDAVVPKSLGWWGMTVGVQGMYELYHKGLLSPSNTPEEIVAKLTENKLTTNHRRDHRGTIGRALHKDFELFGKNGTLPNRKKYAEEDKPRCDAMVNWILENDPEFHAQEVVTASVNHHYAGTFDARCTLRKGPYKGAYVLLDLKSSKYVYPDSHWPQLEAYEAAEIECGEEPTDFRMVLHLPPDGAAVPSISTDTFEDFTILLSAYGSVQRRKGRIKEAKRLAKLAKA